MSIDLQLFREILSFDSTTGNEGPLADFLAERLVADCRESGASAAVPTVQIWDVPEGGRNLLFSWGEPRVVFCTHLDTVPPYIPPSLVEARKGAASDPVRSFAAHPSQAGAWAPPSNDAEGGTPPGGSALRASEMIISGRGACDAKGQIIAMYSACKALAAGGQSGFGLLLVSGEETGSWGAKAFSRTGFKAPYLIVGEPTENKMVSASKGTKAFSLTFSGEAFHSGYPQFGSSAVDAFVDFVNALRKVDFGDDPLLGATTWNIGRLFSDNPQNVLSPRLSCRLYFRTTFTSDGRVAEEVRRIAEALPLEVEEIGGDAPARYLTLPGIGSAPVSFGSDAPHLTGFTHKAICGPGSIRFAHRDDEHISIAELEQAVEQYITIFKLLK